jgi:hypothetical protein
MLPPGQNVKFYLPVSSHFRRRTSLDSILSLRLRPFDTLREVVETEQHFDCYVGGPQ